MKRKGLAMFAALSAILVAGATKSAKSKEASSAPSLRVLDYTYNCIGSGGNCLPTIIITPTK